MILVVDDNVEMRNVMLAMLRLDGYEAAAVDSGPAALAHLATHEPHCVILDYSMPGMDGLEVLRIIRADPRLRDLRVIIYSAHDGPLKDLALAAGADAFVLKASLDWHQLTDVIRQHCKPNQPPRNAIASPNRRHTAG